MLQLTSSEVTVITVTNILKDTKIGRGTDDKLKNNSKIEMFVKVKTVTSEDVCCSIRNVKSIQIFY